MTFAAQSAVSNLQQGTTYHYRLVATNRSGTGYGSDAVFTTTARPSSATVSNASFGTLVTQPAHATAEAQAGVKDAMLELNWANYEPQPNMFSASYIASMKSQLQSFLAAGDRVTLALGTYNPPAWVLGLQNGRLVDQYGNTSNEPNIVFSQPVRDAVATYLAQVNSDLGLGNLSAIRITSGGGSEMLYQGSAAAPGAIPSYWAYDTGAQGGAGLATGMTASPLIGWKPGQITSSGCGSCTTTHVQNWINWYVGGLDNITQWFEQQLTADGFNGQYQVLTPGDGTRPDGLTNAVNAYLNSTTDATTARGAAWQTYYANLSGQVQSKTMAYVSSMADNSGSPANDLCAAGDSALAVTDPTEDSWSATRYIARLATAYGMKLGGEPPNWASLSWATQAELNYYNDASSNGEMANTFAQYKACHLSVMYWAHDNELWGGDQSTLTFSDYAGFVQQSGGGS